LSISFEHVGKAFGDKEILKDFSLTLPAHGSVAFMGPSGFGKTTLLRLIAGIIQPDSGSIQTSYRQLTVVFQEDLLLSGLTALGNILAVLDRSQKALAMEWLERMHLLDAKDLFPREMSGGMRRRLALARAMAYGGDLVLLDEPFAGLDDHTREQIYPYIFPHNDTSKLTILVTHDRQEAMRLADRVIVMDGIPLRVSEDVY